MKQKVFGYSFIFLVIFQLFSPWMMSFSKTGINVNTNIAQAAISAASRGNTVACSIDAVTKDQAFLTVGTAPGTTVYSIGIFSGTTQKAKGLKQSKENTKELFYAMRRSDQKTSGPYYLSSWTVDLTQDLTNRSDVYCTVTPKNSNSAYESGVFNTPSSAPTNLSKYKDAQYSYTDPATKAVTKIDAKIIDPEDWSNNAIQFAPFAMNVLKSKENGKNTFQIAYLSISKNREMADGSNPFMNKELSSTIKGGNSNPKDEIETSEVVANNVTYYQKYDSKIPGLDGYYEWVFLDKKKIIDDDNNSNYAIDSSVSTSLSFMGSANTTAAAGALGGIGAWFISTLVTYFTNSSTTLTYGSIPFQYNGTDSGMHFSGILRDVYNEVKDLQPLTGGGNERFIFGIDKAKSAEGDGGIGIIVALEYGPDDWNEVITSSSSINNKTAPSAYEVLESQVFDNYYDENLLSGDAGEPIIINKKEINPEWEGFAIVLKKDTSPSIDLKNLDAKVISLNPYLIGDKSNDDPFIIQNYNNPINNSNKRTYPFYNQRKIYIPINITKDFFGTSDTLKEGDPVYAYIISKEDSTGKTEISSIIRFDITNKIDQKGRPYGAISDISQNKTDDSAPENWLPKCDASIASTWLQGCIVVGFYYIVFVPTAALLAFAGYMLDKVLVYSISPDAYKAQYIVDGWRFIRDLCNLFFIFMLIYLAFKVILGIGHGTKQLIVNTLIIATIINFSYPLATVVIDVSNITARQLYYNAFNKKDATSGEPIGLSATATSGYNPQTLIVDSMETNGLDKDKEKGTIFIILLMGVIFNIIAMFMFLRIAMQFIFRILGLVFAIILSPLAVFSYSLDGETRGKLKMVGFDQWLNGLLTDCFKAPVFLFLVLVMTLFINDNPFKSALVPGDVNNLEWWMSLIIPFALIMGFLMIIESATKSMSSGLSNMASEKFMATVGKAGSFAIGGAAGLVTGGAATLGRSTVGKWAAKSAENIRNSGKDNWINRQRLKMLDKTSKASFDVRQSAVGSYVTKQTGVNMDNPLVGKIPGMSTAATAGGYMAMKDRAKKKEIDRAELLGHDKKLEENLNHEKENKEGELKDIEKNDEINRTLLKELSQQLRENTDALDKKEKEITSKADEEIRSKDAAIKDADSNIAQITAKMTAATTLTEKASLKRSIDDAVLARNTAVSEKAILQTNKTQALKNLRETDPEGIAVTETKEKIKEAKETEAELSKKKNDIKFGVEIEVVKKDSHGKVSYKKDSSGNVIINPTTGEPEPEMVKVRSGGIAGVDKALSRVKNNKMLEATLRHRKKSTGDTIELKTYLQKYTEDFNGDEDKAIAQLKKEFKDDYEKIGKTNYAGSAGKPGHMHEVTHMINDHFHPEQHKSNYKPPAGGGGSKTSSNDHGHDAGHSDPAHH